MFDHLGVKLVCLLVAIVLWVQVASHVEVEEIVRLPVVLVGLPDSLSVRHRDVPSEVAVRVRGTRLQLLLSDLGADDRGRVQVDLSHARAGAYRRDLSALDVQVSAQPLQIEPAVTLDLTIQARLCRRVPVHVAIAGQLPEGFTLAGRPEVIPSEVEVCGPEPVVRSLGHVNTRPISVARRRESFRETLQLQPPDADVQLHPTEAEVSLTVDAIVERSFAGVQVICLGHGDGPPAEVDPPRALVRVRGPGHAVTALRPEQVRVTVHVREHGGGVHQVAGEVVLPEGIGVTAIEPPTFQVVLGDESGPGPSP